MAAIRVKYTLEGIEEAEKRISELEKKAKGAGADGLKEINEELKDLNDYVKRANDSFKAFDKTTEGADKALKNFSKENERFGKLIVSNEDGMIELTASISKLEDQLYHLRATGQQNTEEFDQIQKKVSEFKQVVIETDREIDQLAENKGFAAIGGGLSMVAERLVSLDFEGAAKSATLLNNQMGSLGDAGAKAMKGIATTVTQLSGTFIKMGAALLLNPIFLIGAAVAAIVAAIVALMSKLGILQPILDGIAWVFGKIGDAIDLVIQGFKDFTDWLGLTDHAGKAFIENQIKEFDKYSKASQKAHENRIFDLDEEAKIAQIRGQETIDIEAEKQNAIIRTSRAEAEKAEIILRAAKGREDIDKEELKRIRERYNENYKLIKQAESELRVIAVQKEQKAIDEAAKSEKERADNAKKYADQARKYAQDRINAERMITDLVLASMKEGEEKELAENAEKYRRLLEDTKKSETLIASEKKRVSELLEAERVLNENRIISENTAKRLEIEINAEEEARKIRQASRDEFLNELEKHNEEVYKATLFDHEREIIELQDYYFNLIEQSKQYGEDTAELESQLAQRVKSIRDNAYLVDLEAQSETLAQRLFYLKEAQRIELEETELTELEKTEIAKRYSDERKQLVVDEMGSGLNQISNALNIFSDLQNAKMEADLAAAEGNEAKQTEIRKKAFEQNKKMQIAQATIQMITGAVSAFSGAMQLGPIAGPIVGGLLAAAVLATGAMNIKRISKTKFDSGDSGGGGGATPSANVNIPEVNNTTPEVKMFGASSNFSEGSEPISKETTPWKVELSISEYEITSTQNTVMKQKENSSI